MKLDFVLIKNFKLVKSLRDRHIDSVMRAYKFKFIGEGTERRTYMSHNGRYVLKFPINESGLDSNRNENLIWRKYNSNSKKHGIVYAPCRLINNTILMMWSCTESFGDSMGCEEAFKRGTLKKCSLNNMPDWVTELDCWQAGILRNGKLAAYDYG